MDSDWCTCGGGWPSNLFGCKEVRYSFTTFVWACERLLWREEGFGGCWRGVGFCALV